MVISRVSDILLKIPRLSGLMIGRAVYTKHAGKKHTFRTHSSNPGSWLAVN